MYYVLKTIVPFPSGDVDTSTYDGGGAVFGSAFPFALTLDHAVELFVQLVYTQFREDAIANDLDGWPHYNFSDLFTETCERECAELGTSDGKYAPNGWDPEEWKREVDR